MYAELHITSVVPALDEEEAIGLVVGDLLALRDARGRPLVDQVIVADNGSTDATAALARQAGARVVAEPRRGYGAACLAAIAEAGETDVFLFVDGDRSVAVEQVPALLAAIGAGADLAIGSRTLGRVESGAMTWPQVAGNRLVARLIARLWSAGITDLGPLRAIRRAALQRLDLRDRAYGWTVEMQVKALQHGLAIREIPVDCRVRLGRSKVSGTLRGVVGAGFGMLGMVLRLWWRGRGTQADGTRFEPAERLHEGNA